MNTPLVSYFLLFEMTLPELGYSDNNNPAGNYIFTVSNKNSRKRWEICFELTIKTPEWRQWLKHISLCSSVSIVNFEEVNAGWEHVLYIPMGINLSEKQQKEDYSNVLWYRSAPFFTINKFQTTGKSWNH